MSMSMENLTLAAARDSLPPERPRLNLRRFPIKKMPDNSTCVIVAESQGGKTILGIDLLWHKRHLPAWFLFSTSEGCSQRLSQTIPPTYTYSTFDLEALEKIYRHQETKIKRYTRPRTEEERRKVPDDELTNEERFTKNPCVGGYYEDCFGDKKVFNKAIVGDLFKNGRHRMMFSIIPCQYIMNLGIDLRKQVKYWFLLREDSQEVRKKLFTHVGGACKTLEIFNEVMDQCTHDYGCVVIDNISKSKRIEDRVFWYKADLHPAFRVGSSRYWRFHKKNYQDNADKLNPDEEEARRILGRNKRQRAPPQRMKDLPQGAVAQFGDAVTQRTAHNYLDTPSMVEFYNRGAQRVEDYLLGGTRSRKFDVQMVNNDKGNGTTASSATVQRG